MWCAPHAAHIQQYQKLRHTILLHQNAKMRQHSQGEQGHIAMRAFLLCLMAVVVVRGLRIFFFLAEASPCRSTLAPSGPRQLCPRPRPPRVRRRCSRRLLLQQELQRQPTPAPLVPRQLTPAPLPPLHLPPPRLLQPQVVQPQLAPLLLAPLLLRQHLLRQHLLQLLPLQPPLLLRRRRRACLLRWWICRECGAIWRAVPR